MQSFSTVGTVLRVPEEQQTVTVRFFLRYKTSWGQGVKLIGSHPKLGSWSLNKAIDLRWSNNDVWTATVSLPAGSVLEYKYVVIDYESKEPLSWQSGSNAVLALELEEEQVDVHDNWGNNPGAEVRASGMAFTREDKLQNWAKDMLSKWQQAVKENQDLQTKVEESQMARAEVAQLRMELSLLLQSQKEREMQVLSLQQENTKLQQELLQSQRELNESLSTALSLLSLDSSMEEEAGETRLLSETSGRSNLDDGFSGLRDSGNGNGSHNSDGWNWQTQDNGLGAFFPSWGSSSSGNGNGSRANLHANNTVPETIRNTVNASHNGSNFDRVQPSGSEGASQATGGSSTDSAFGNSSWRQSGSGGSWLPQSRRTTPR